MALAKYNEEYSHWELPQTYPCRPGKHLKINDVSPTMALGMTRSDREVQGVSRRFARYREIRNDVIRTLQYQQRTKCQNVKKNNPRARQNVQGAHLVFFARQEQRV